MIKPALRHVTEAIGESLNLPIIVWNFEFIHFCVASALEWNTLMGRSSSTFMESLHGVERIDTTGQVGERDFPTATQFQRIFSFAYVVLLPKILLVLQHYRSDALGEEDTVVQQNDNLYVKIRKYLLTMFYTAARALELLSKSIKNLTPWIAGTENAATMILRILYVLKRSYYHNPIFAILGMKLVKSRKIPRLEENTTATANANWTLKTIFALIFAMREHLVTRLQQHSSLADFPKAPKAAPGCIRPMGDKSLCPICCKERVNACAASSGYVYCYMCIIEEIRRNGKCPVTNIPCQEKDLIKIYED
jgi:hypothetical protein